MKAYKMEWVEDPAASPAKLVNGYFVPGPLYRQMERVIRAFENSLDGVGHDDTAMDELDKLEKLKGNK